MKYLKIKNIIVEEDKRESNLTKNSKGDIIGYKQSKCTVRFIFEDNNKEEYTWVKENKDLAKAIELIAENEERKYNVPEKEIQEFPSGKFLLGRYLFFISWIYPIYDKIPYKIWIENSREIFNSCN